jgi:pimeloyl-ACP methyl ester carboxylesterase
MTPTRVLSTATALFVAAAVTACDGGSDTSAGADPSASTTQADPFAEDGALVDVGGRDLYLHCQGTAGPIVLLEAGLTGDSRTWNRVVAGLDPAQRVCAYDRANTGRSDPAPTPRSSQDVVDDLGTLLQTADLAPPYVLVSHSFGGIHVQLFAAEHPEEVAGLVLVESNHPDEAHQFEDHLTAEQVAADRAEVQANSEGIDVFASLDEAAAAGPLPTVPLVVVTAARGDGWPPGWDPALFDQLRAGQQADLATRVPGGAQVIAEHSGHDVPGEQPEVIVDAIAQVLTG